MMGLNKTAEQMIEEEICKEFCTPLFKAHQSFDRIAKLKSSNQTADDQFISEAKYRLTEYLATREKKRQGKKFSDDIATDDDERLVFGKKDSQGWEETARAVADRVKDKDLE
jgi:hypothetical protein